ncbi:MAG: sulfatase-like hydrolase/transferase [Lentisphaeria bacterium]|nr:sulfatase-like hydrolase/transferase [Lentisphaeria bacterium]
MAEISRPNILILHADQQRFDTINALGHGHVHSPNLDRLVRGGRAYTRAYSSCPVSMPARHDLLTGASARHHGYYTNSNAFIQDHGLATMPRLLTEAGYQTIAVGKMHHNPPREHHGYAHMYSMEELPSCREDDAYLQYLESVGYGHIRCQHGVRPLFYHTPQPARVPEEHHGSAWVAHKTIEVLQEERDRPWLIISSWVGPHPPYYVPQKYLDMYRDAELPPPCPIPPGGEKNFAVSPENPEPTGIRMQRMREAYFAACTLIDTHIGRVLDALEETGQLENTLIFFTSDHGEMLGDHGGYQKHTPHEGSAHIPFLVHGPGFAAGTRSEMPVNTWDVTATILEATGVSVPEDHPLAGCSLLGESDFPSNRIVCFHHGRGRGRYVAAVGRRHKFVHYHNGGEETLHDLAADPEEQCNLLAGGTTTPEIESLVTALRAKAIAFESEFGMPEMVSDGSFVDLPHAPLAAHQCSLYPPWSSRQYPPWPNGYSPDDLESITNEMRDCLNSDVAYVCHEPEWRENALQIWEGMGGARQTLLDIFASADSKAK